MRAMSKKTLIAVAIGLAVLTAQAQAQTPTQAPAAAPSAAKKELVARILKQQQAAIENMGRTLAEQPAAEIMDNAAAALPARVARDKQQAVAKQIHDDVQAYLNEAVPLVQGSAVKLAPTTIGPVLEQNFTEDELKQLVAMIESPIYAKFQQLGPDMQKALADRVIAETRGTIEPKVRTLEQAVGKRLGVGSPAATPPAAAASRPAKKK